jgi:hypothetical protein
MIPGHQKAFEQTEDQRWWRYDAYDGWTTVERLADEDALEQGYEFS